MTKAILFTEKLEEGIEPIEVLNFPDDGDHLDFYYDNVECSMVDIVPAYGLEHAGMPGYDLVVDDEGLLNGKEINILASLLYGYGQHGQPIVGSALVVKRIATPEGMDSAGLAEGEILNVITGLNLLIAEHNAKMDGEVENGEES